MGIINGYYDVDMVITDLNENDIRSMVAGRQFAVIRIEPEIVNQNRRTINGFKFYPRYMFELPYFREYSLQIDDGNEANGRTYLCIDNELPVGANAAPLCAKVRDGVSIQYLSIEELLPMVLGKRLIYHTEYVEDHCCVESVINRKMQEHIFRLREDEDREELDEKQEEEQDEEQEGVFYLYDNFFSVEVFLQKISGDDAGEQEFLQPADVRDFDINKKILSTLKKGSNSFYHDAMTINYASVSDQLQAQYFLAKFHSNRLWELNPVCILNYRISTFILPHSISKERAADFPEDRIAYDIKHKTRYVIDSIHVDSDICFSLSEFDELIDRFMYNIRLA